MRLKTASIGLATLIALGVAVRAQAVNVPSCTLYGNEAADEGRQFYRIDRNTADGTLIGDPGQGVTGLAFHPFTGVLYGSTAAISIESPTASTLLPGHLITINPLTGAATDVGSFGLGMSGAGSTLADLAFDPATGVLYGWRSGGDGDLYRVNLQSGAATLVGESGLSGLFGGALEFVPGIGLLAALEGAQGPLRTIDPSTGLPIDAIALTGYGSNASIAALTWNEAGLLYGVTRKDGDLIRIDPTTGEVETIGPAADDEAAIDGLAFSPCGTSAPASSWGALLVIFLGLSAIGVWQTGFRSRRRQTSPA